MKKVLGLTGDEAVALAAKQCDVDVVSAYPITPQTIMVERFSEYVANGEVKTEFVCVESEHSALSACVGASLTGARVFTATSSQGLALMHEIMYIASALRCPIVMGVANRALSAPINIHGDHSDMMGSRDSGWIQVYAENSQEAYDLVIQAFKIAEDPEVLLPITVNLDGFIISHCMEGVEVLEDDAVRKFLPERKADFKIDPDKPLTIGPLCLPDFYFEFKRQQEEAMKNVPSKVKKVGKEFGRLTGRTYDVLHTYQIEDADAAIVCLGSTAGTARVVAEKMRKEGKKVGLVKIMLYRPFPVEEFRNAVKHLKALAVLDRACSPGAPAASLCSDVKTTLYEMEHRPNVFNVIYGLGGRDITPKDIEEIFKKALKTAETGIVEQPVMFVGVRE
jgi:pyruvate ferredoxin oxidoreductase alpha subunit